ncbi:MAG TPA: CaiB/BaiF CoA-transferase family protein [Amycolatopsis sp.]|nr:CaiB/BaiF CoA-transferase family protein [Amycolatopsis sp.]
MSRGPLTGFRVLDLTRFPPGAYCTTLLADLGADVVRVEPPAGAGKVNLVAGQVGLSRGKRSMTLDLRHPHAATVLRRLAGGVDVLVENNRPGDLAARGFGYADAAAENPGLVWCSITGYGQDGPYADRAGHDLSYVAHSGLLGALEPALPWHPRTMLSVPLGAMMAATGILAAVLERGRTGKGAQVDISLAESATWLLSGDAKALTDGPATGVPVSPGRRLYECADGEFISVAAAEPRTWRALCQALDLPDLVDEVRPVGAAATTITERLSALFATRTAAEWLARLGPAGAAVGAVNRGGAVAKDPHYRERGAILEVAGVPVPANPIRLRDVDGPRPGTAISEPARAGEHTDDVLSEAGFSQQGIEDLRVAGLV